VKIIVGRDEGQWLKGTRVKKVVSRPGDAHQDGALGAIVGALGPTTASQRAEIIIDLAKQGINGDKLDEIGSEIIETIQPIPGVSRVVSCFALNEAIKTD